jgi:two-component system sensor histidine kinase LytS
VDSRRFTLVEIVLIAVTVALAVIAIAAVLTRGYWIVFIVCAVIIAVVVFITITFSNDPDRLRARQSERMLKLAASTLTHMRKGLNTESAGEVCKLLLPATSANAVAITDREVILGFAGAEKESHSIGSPIRTEATKTSILTAEMKVLTKKSEIGFPDDAISFRAAIIVPLILREEVVGALKFYYRTANKIDETEQAVAYGLSTLLAMQLSIAELDYQRELAAQMELKALQAQIKPHFLFNTINTITSLIRTDPAQARILLREFATFYRRTLEASLDYISLEQELLQTLRYFGFEIARFGNERVILTSNIEQGLESIQVPAFIIQPLVENAVGHAMREDAPLHIHILACVLDERVVIEVKDDGIGMTKDTLVHMFDPTSQHMGVALKNVDDRLRGYFGRGAHLAVQSELGVGTTVSMNIGLLKDLKVDADDQGNPC